MTTRAETGQIWPPQIRRTFDRLGSLAVFWTGMAFLTVSIAFVLVPDSVNWKHFVAAGAIGLKGLILIYLGIRLIRIVSGKVGKRRAR